MNLPIETHFFYYKNKSIIIGVLSELKCLFALGFKKVPLQKVSKHTSKRLILKKMEMQSSH